MSGVVKKGRVTSARTDKAKEMMCQTHESNKFSLLFWEIGVTLCYVVLYYFGSS